MDITVYLPDEIGAWAKEAELPLSRMLRDAVSDEKRQREAMARTLENALTYDREVEGDDEIGTHTACIHGAPIGTMGDFEVFLGNDGQGYIYNGGRYQLEMLTPDELADRVEEWDELVRVAILRALGRPVVIHYGARA